MDGCAEGMCLLKRFVRTKYFFPLKIAFVNVNNHEKNNGFALFSLINSIL